MNHFVQICIATLFLAGCDAISETKVELSPRHADGTTVTTDEVIGIVTKTAAVFGLEEIERRDTDTSFSDFRLRIGQNPHLGIIIKHSSNPTGIEIREMFIASPTDKHKRIAQSLVHDLNAGGCNASIAYQTPGPRKWQWLIGPAIVIVAFLTWKFTRNRQTEKHRDIAT